MRVIGRCDYTFSQRKPHFTERREDCLYVAYCFSGNSLKSESESKIVAIVLERGWGGEGLVMFLTECEKIHYLTVLSIEQELKKKKKKKKI